MKQFFCLPKFKHTALSLIRPRPNFVPFFYLKTFFCEKENKDNFCSVSFRARDMKRAMYKNYDTEIKEKKLNIKTRKCNVPRTFLRPK